MIRRTKATVAIQLPPRFEKTVRLRFMPQEKVYYESIERPGAEVVGNEWDKAQVSSSVWLSVLQQIHLLRSICNLGTAAARSHPALALCILNNEDTASRMLSARLVMGDGSCQHCSTMFDLSQQASRPENDSLCLAYYSSCYKIFCSTCAALFNFVTPAPCDCEGANINCSLQSIPLQELTPTITPQSGSVTPGAGGGNPLYISTKVSALLSDLVMHPEEKR